MVLSYLALSFTDGQSPSKVYKIGQLYLISLAALMTANILVLSVTIVKTLYKSAKRYYYKQFRKEKEVDKEAAKEIS